MDPKRRMGAEEKRQAWENERKKLRQDQRIEEGSGGIHSSTEGEKRSEDKEVKNRKKKKK